MTVYTAIEGQSIWDVCLNTYGSFDYMVKLLTDNNVDNVNLYPINGQSYQWDETLTANQAVNQQAQNSGTIYATKALVNGSIYSIVQSGGGSKPISGSSGGNYYSPVNPVSVVKYQKTFEVQYTGVGGELSFIPVDINGNAVLSGATIVQITREIQPLKTTDYTFNSSNGQLNLTGNTLAPLETIYVIAGIIVTS